MSNITQDNQLIASISANRLVIKDIFCDDFLFTIPNYQRPYSWEEEHCTQLLDDLHSFAFRDESFNDLPPYFLGSAVIIKKENSRNAQIVDGQQRLTTLTILLACLRYSITDEDNKKTISNLIFQKGNELLGTSDNYRLKTRLRDQEYFKSLIQEYEGIKNCIDNPNFYAYQNDAQEQMLTNTFALIKAFEKKQYTQEQLNHLTKYIILKCIIVIVASTDEDMAFRIFNVLNDRGKDLTIADILKSEVLEKIEDTNQDNYTKKWEDCETKLGIDNFKDFFSHLRAIYAKKKAEKSILSELREYVNPSFNAKSFIDKVLIPFTNAYEDILNNKYESSVHADSINNQFVKLKRIAHSDWIPSAIFYVAKYNTESDKILNFLLQLERVTLGMEAMKASLNERIERYARINEKIENNNDLYQDTSELMLNSTDREYIISTLKGPDLYGKRLVKAVLTKIEEQLNDSSITIAYSNLSIEHILPKTPTEHYWTSRFKSDDRTKWTNNLGNLSLISVRKNSQASNYSFIDKIDVYFKADGKASNLSMVNNLKVYKNWNVTTIKERNIELLNVFLKALNLAEVPIEQTAL